MLSVLLPLPAADQPAASRAGPVIFPSLTARQPKVGIKRALAISKGVFHNVPIGILLFDSEHSLKIYLTGESRAGSCGGWSGFLPVIVGRTQVSHMA